VFLDLFDGHDIPAMYWAQGRRPGFYQSPGMNRALTFEAHLLGAVLAGSYPFRGVRPGCGCSARAHSCDGRGCTYLCLDLDAHKGESDVEARCRRLLVVAWRAGMLPVVFSSRSGRGAHVYVFFTAPVPTRVAHEAGVALARAASILDRCDVIPSAEHQAGLGTLHALPCSPMAEPGGGVLYDSNLSPVADEARMVSMLRWADTNRTPAHVIEDVATGARKLVQSAATAYVLNPSPAVGVVAFTARVPFDRAAEPTEADEMLLRTMRALHPQFRRALATPAGAWKGRRSSRDSYLVAYMRRQGMTAAGVVAAMCALPGTKAQERGPSYAWTLVETQVRPRAPEERLAGQKLTAPEARVMREMCPWSPWDVRVPPPQRYGESENPWWRAGVQERIHASRSTKDGIVLGHLIDRYYRGPIKRRMFFASQRMLGKRLGFPAQTVGVAVQRLAERFPDVLRVVFGVSHPTLRVANGYYVPERGHLDAVSWYVAPGRCSQRTLYSAPSDRGLRPRNGSAESPDAGTCGGAAHPF
jgi:hypothetical protein